MTPLYLVAQAAADPGLQSEIARNPYFAGLLIAILFAALVALGKIALVQFERRVNEKFARQEEHNRQQDGRLDHIEADLQKYDTHVAVGASESREIHAALARVESALTTHTEKEESVTWGKIDSLVDAVNEMRLSNEKAHAGMVTGQEVLATRVTAVEKKMPNGELARLADAFDRLSKK